MNKRNLKLLFVTLILAISIIVPTQLTLVSSQAEGYIRINSTEPSTPGQQVQLGGNVSLYFGEVEMPLSNIALAISQNSLSELTGQDFIYSATFPGSNITNLTYLTTVSNASYGFWEIQNSWVNGSTPREIQTGNYYIKLVNMDTSEIVAVSDTYITVVVLGFLEVSPDSGLGGVDVQFTGSGFTPNSEVAISYYDTYSKEWNFWENQITNDSGVFQFTKKIPDLGLSVNGIYVQETTKPLSFKAYGDGVLAYADYNQYLRGLKTVGGQAALGLFGNGSDLTLLVNVKVGDSFEISGKYFQPSDTVYVLWDGHYEVGTVTDIEWSSAVIASSSIVNSTGGFSTEFNVPLCSIGPHYIAVEDSESKIIVRINVTNSTTLNISPSIGTGGISVQITGHDFPADSTVDLMYLDTSVDSWELLSSVTANQSGQIEYNFTMPDLGKSVGNSIWSETSTSSIDFRAQIDEIVYSKAYYSQYLRGLKTVGDYTVDGLFGNGTDLTSIVRVESGESITITGQWFHPRDVIYVRWDGTDVVGTVTGDEWSEAEILETAIADSTGNFSLQITIPTAAVGDHYIAIEDSQAKVIIKVLLSPATLQITPNSGPGGAVVRILGFDFPIGSQVTLEYFNPTTGEWNYWMSNTTDSIGNARFTVEVPDLKNMFGNGTFIEQYSTLAYRVLVDEAIYGRINYNQYYRGLVKVGNQVANGFYGNGTTFGSTVQVRTGDTLNLAGLFFHPGVVYIRWDGEAVVGTVTANKWDQTTPIGTAIANASGYFDATVTIPTADAGLHYISVEDSQTRQIIIVETIEAPQPTPTPTPSPTPSTTVAPPPPPPPPPPTPTPTATSTITPSPTATASPTITPIPTVTPQPTPTQTAEPTPAPTPTPIATPTPTQTPKPTPKPSPKPTPTITVSCKSTTASNGFKVEINGEASLNNTGLSGKNIQLYLSKDGGNEWESLTMASTDYDGKFNVIWISSTSGVFMLKAELASSSGYNQATTIVTFAIESVSDSNQNVFTMTSNSTISQLYFNSETSELSFVASGETNTQGYVNVNIPKTLISDISNLKVYLDGTEVTFSSSEETDSWTITIEYAHSTHNIIMDLSNDQAPNQEQPTSQWIIIGASIAIIAIVATIIVAVSNKNRIKR